MSMICSRSKAVTQYQPEHMRDDLADTEKKEKKNFLVES